METKKYIFPLNVFDKPPTSWVAPSSSEVGDITSPLSWSSRSCQVGQNKPPQFFENRVSLAPSSTAIFAENVGWFKVTELGVGGGTWKFQTALIKIQLFFAWWSISLVLTILLVCRIPKKLVLTVFASLFITLAEGWAFGVAYSAIVADILVCFWKEETDSASRWLSHHLIPATSNLKTWVLLNCITLPPLEAQALHLLVSDTALASVAVIS